MQAKLLFPALLIVILAAPVLASAYNTVPLEWDDNPDELLPGYAAELRVHAFGAAATGLFPLGAFADAVGCVGPVCMGLVGDDGLIPVTVKIRVGSYEHVVDKIYAGFREYDAHFTIKLHCPGEDVGGLTVDEDHAVLEVYTAELGRRDYFVIPVRDNMAPDLRGYYEETYTGQRSWYEFYDFTRFKDCGGGYIGDQPDDSSGNAPDGKPDDFLGWLEENKWLVGLGAVVLILILLRGLLPW